MGNVQSQSTKGRFKTGFTGFHIRSVSTEIYFKSHSMSSGTVGSEAKWTTDNHTKKVVSKVHRRKVTKYGYKVSNNLR